MFKLERYNKSIKLELWEKRFCNWVIFLNFINNEILRIKDILNKNENINVAFKPKKTKFGIEKYKKKPKKKLYNESKEYTIADKWLINKGNNCRYNDFITMSYFNISPFLYNLNDNNFQLLNKLNDLILIIV